MYVPKSHYTADLYTNGGELMFASNKNEYVGYYWRYANGKLYSGRNPYSGTSQLLSPIKQGTFDINRNPSISVSQILVVDNKDPEPFLVYDENANQIVYPVDNETYNKLYFNRNDVFQNRRIVPQAEYVEPTSRDYQRKEYIRYFLIQSHPDKQIFEVSKLTYDAVKSQSKYYLWEFFEPISVGWRVGLGTKEEVGKVNQTQVKLLSEKRNVPAFYDYFKGQFTEFYREA